MSFVELWLSPFTFAEPKQEGQTRSEKEQHKHTPMAQP
jgi:hypothetical protein